MCRSNGSKKSACIPNVIHLAFSTHQSNSDIWLKSIEKRPNHWYLGLSAQRFMKVWDQGDILSIQSKDTPTNTSGKNTQSKTSLVLQWHGLIIGEGDELYHSQYQNVDGTEVIELPDAVAVVEMRTDIANISSHHDWFCIVKTA
jgi:hypothetical protein